MTRFCIVGAGFSGAVIGRALAEAGHNVLVVDERAHVGGNCHCARDAQTGIMTHVYGPHIFHTDDESVWRYIQRFGAMAPYRHRVQAISAGRIFSLPVNLSTINQFFNKTMSPEEARAFLAERVWPIPDPRNFEEQALGSIGEDLYHAFFRGYTIKQWGLEPRLLPSSVFKRLPVRFDHDDRYFSHRHQAIPLAGYTAMVEKILDAPRLELRLGTPFETLDETFAHIVYTGPIDRFFDFRLGRLGYRTLDFETIRGEGDFQRTAVLNYCDEDVAYTRVTEHKHLSPWEKDRIDGSICYREFSRACGPHDIPYYPIRLAREQAMLRPYIELARATPGVSFVGRLGTYRYLDMDVTISEALSAANAFLSAIAGGDRPPAFFVEP
jgi:UDP-galactopyranose mutase